MKMICDDCGSKGGALYLDGSVMCKSCVEDWERSGKSTTNGIEEGVNETN